MNRKRYHVKARFLGGICIVMVVLISLPELTFSEEPVKKKTPQEDPAPADDQPSFFQKVNQEKAKTTPDEEKDEEATEEEKPKLLPIPEKALIAEAMTLVRDLFQADFKAAKTNVKKSELAKKILEAGVDTEDDAAGRFVLLRLARNIASSGNDLETAMEAIDKLEETFEVDALAMRVAVLDQIAPKARNIKLRKLIHETSMGLIDRAIAEDQFEAAEKLRKYALTGAKSTHNAKLINQLNARKKEIADLVKEFKVVKTALGTLETNPTDPQANLTVGRYFCYVRGDWEKGLPMLALSGDASLKSMAIAELAKPSTAVEQVKLGNGWWDIAASASGSNKKQLLWRAGHWYEMALPELKGLTKTITERRLAKIPERPVSAGPGELQTFYLDDLLETSSQVHPGILGKHGSKGFHSGKGKVNGKVPQHALSAHPPKSESSSIVTYSLGGRFISLNTVATLWDDGGIRNGPLTFKVIGDGKLLWQSRPIQKAGQWQQCKVSLKGVKTLTLQIDCPGSYHTAHAVWLNPQVVGRAERLPKSFKGMKPGLVAEIYAGMNFEKKLKTQIDRAVYFKWDRRPPATPRPAEKQFSIRWTGWLRAPQPGTYRLRVVSDDGVRLWLDGRLLIDEWKSHPVTGYDAQVTLTSKPHKLRIEYFDQGYDAVMQFLWARGSGKEARPVPPQALFHSK